MLMLTMIEAEKMQGVKPTFKFLLSALNPKSLESLPEDWDTVFSRC